MMLVGFGDRYHLVRSRRQLCFDDDAGSIIMGVYLLVSVNVFGRHSEEAFSGLRMQDFKHFLRLHIDNTGKLTIHPIKVERVPRKWRDRKDDDTSPSTIQPAEELVAERIEAPIAVR